MKKRTKQNILSFILTSSIFLTMPSIPAWANPEEELFDGSPANPVHHCTPSNDRTDDTDWSYVNASEGSVVPALHITATAAEPIKKETTEVVQEVISGKWGNMPERKRRLEAAGYNYAEVQAEVNALIKESK